jgi:WD40 repeat protein
LFFFAKTESRPTALALSHDGQDVAWGHSDASVEVLDVNTGDSARRFRVPGKSLIMLNASPDGGLISGSSDGKFTFWEPRKWKAVRTVALPGKSKLRAARVTANGSRAITLTESTDEISLWDLATCDRVRVLAKGLGFRDLALSDDGRFAMAGLVADAPRMWDLELDGAIRRLPMPVPVLSRRKQPTFLGSKLFGVGRTAVTIGRGSGRAMSAHDSTIILWDLTNGKSVRQIPCLIQMIQSLRMTDDGRLAIAAGATSTMSGAIQIFDIDTGNTVALAGLDSLVERFSISSNGRDVFVQDAVGALYCLRLMDSSRGDIQSKP